MESSKEDFCKQAEEALTEFREHVGRVQEQYTQLSKLKENLTAGHVIAQMDFVENYLCQSLEEVQSPWWNRTMVTLYQVVAYYKNDGGEMQHKSFVLVSSIVGSQRIPLWVGAVLENF